ncbi:MAG: hypothetical protein ABSD92_06815 [Candidatus Bathyarchaeia archaeon]
MHITYPYKHTPPMLNVLKGGDEMLSRDCDGCTLLHVCCERYKRVSKDEKVYCPDGTAHLVDQN